MEFGKLGDMITLGDTNHRELLNIEASGPVILSLEQVFLLIFTLMTFFTMCVHVPLTFVCSFFVSPTFFKMEKVTKFKKENPSSLILYDFV